LAARADGATMPFVAKFMAVLAELGYDKFLDDVTMLAFGARTHVDGIYEDTFRTILEDIDKASQDLAAWCREAGWPEDVVTRVQLVFEEKVMNVHDHGFDERDRLREAVSVRLRRVRDAAVLTVWDAGAEEPSLSVAAGDSSTAFEKANQSMSGRGRGRLIVRELCDGIERNRYPPLNETTYHIPFSGKRAEGRCENGGEAK